MRYDLPWLWQIQDDPVQVGLVDAAVGVPDLDLVVPEGILSEHGRHVLAGPGGEVLTDFIAGHLGARPQEGHGQRPRSDSGFEHLDPRMDVGQHENRSEVLGVDHLGPSRHLQDELGQCRTERVEDTPPVGLDRGAILTSDDVVVSDDSGVRVKLGTGLEGH